MISVMRNKVWIYFIYRHLAEAPRLQSHFYSLDPHFLFFWFVSSCLGQSPNPQNDICMNVNLWSQSGKSDTNPTISNRTLNISACLWSFLLITMVTLGGWGILQNFQLQNWNQKYGKWLKWEENRQIESWKELFFLGVYQTGWMLQSCSRQICSPVRVYLYINAFNISEEPSGVHVCCSHLV